MSLKANIRLKHVIKSLGQGLTCHLRPGYNISINGYGQGI